MKRAFSKANHSAPLYGALAKAALLLFLVAFGTLPLGAVVDTNKYIVSWVERVGVGSPGPRYGHAMAYDSERGVTVFFGGEFSEVGGDPECFNDTWEYDGVSWKRIAIEGPSPAPRTRHAMCYDNLLDKVILFGGKNNGEYYNDVWNYESTGPQTGRWVPVNYLSEDVRPGPIAAHTMIFQYFEGKALVAGGTPDPSTSEYPQTSAVWEWDNAEKKWRRLTKTVGYSSAGLGAGLTDHTMLYDYRRHETIVIGGVGPFGTRLEANARIFEVVGQNGNYLSGGSGDVEGSLIYDGFLDIYFHFGGIHYDPGEIKPSRASPGYERIWYRGYPGFPDSYRPSEVNVEFRSGFPAVGPGDRTQCAMVYDEKRRVTILFGGVGGARYNDTWELVTSDHRDTWVDFAFQGFEVGTFNYPFKALAKGINSVVEGGRLHVKPGRTSETFSRINKPMTIQAAGPVGSTVVIGKLP